MYRIYVVFKCFEGKREEYLNALKTKGYIDMVRKEEGCVRYDYYLSDKDSNELLLIEEWETQAHQVAHIDTPHMAEVRLLAADYVESKFLGEFTLV